MSSPGFNAGGNGSSEYFSGRSTNTINNLTTTNNLHHNLSLYRTQQQQPLPPIFLDPSSQIPQQRFIGKRTLAEFQTQQHQTYNINNNLNNINNNNLNNNHVLSNLLLRSVKPRTTNFQFQNNSPSSFSLPELQQNPFNNYQTHRLGVPLQMNPNFHHYRPTSNLTQVINRVQNQTVEPVEEKKTNNDHTLLQELEKQLLDDNDDDGEASVITTSEWSETYQNLIGPGTGPCNGPGPIQAQKQVSSSPTASTTSSTSSSAASPASVCSKQTLIEAANAISEGKNDVDLRAEIMQLVNR